MRAACLLLLLVCALPSRADDSSPPLVQSVILEDKGSRVRWGLSAAGGSTIGWGGFALKGEARVGYQFSRLFCLYGVIAGGGSLSPVSGGQFDLGAVAEFTPV